ncbi:MAG: phosphoribosylamine--glycine ligase [Chloroflexota bacterium]|nr:phosphoribosylamine--glycine ligase [Chloroflexota bacterium]
MKVLVVGSGGREHALVWALDRSPRVDEIHVAPGNGGTLTLATNIPIAADDISGLVDHAEKEGVDLVVVGPEVPLALGLTDAMQDRGIRVFGPTERAARIESSKAYSKDFMRDHGIPTAPYAIFEDYDRAKAYLQEHPAPIVVKASGLAAGKGSIVCQTDEEARQALDEIMRERAFGKAGDRVVIEECLEGEEVSVLAFSDGQTVVPMALAQDHKPAYDGDLGPNTGGMGCYAPAPLLDEATLERVMNEVLQPAVDGLRRAGTPYVGALYAGLMLSDGDFQVLEFNCRFGDPEAQVILPLLESDLVSVLEACIDGTLKDVKLHWSDETCVCVVMASGGYPIEYETGYEIEGLEEDVPNTIVFHAGTKQEDGRVLTDGGRVLGVTAWADDLRSAVDRAYARADRIHWPDVMMRRDIGAKGLREE